MFQKAAKLPGVDEWHPGEPYDSGDSIIYIPDDLQGAWIAIVHDFLTHRTHKPILVWPCGPGPKPSKTICRLRDLARDLIFSIDYIKWTDKEIGDIEKFVANLLPEGTIPHRQQDTSDKHMSTPEEMDSVKKLADALWAIVDKGGILEGEVRKYAHLIPLPQGAPEELRSEIKQNCKDVVQAKRDLLEAINTAKSSIPGVYHFLRQVYEDESPVWSSDLTKELRELQKELHKPGDNFVLGSDGQDRSFWQRLNCLFKEHERLDCIVASDLKPPAPSVLADDTRKESGDEKTASVEDRQTESGEGGESKSQPDENGFVKDPSDKKAYCPASKIISAHWPIPPLPDVIVGNRYKPLNKILDTEPTIHRWRPDSDAPPEYQKYRLCIHLGHWTSYVDRLKELHSLAVAIAAGKQHWRCKKCRTLFPDKPGDTRCPDPKCDSDDIEPVMTR